MLHRDRRGWQKTDETLDVQSGKLQMHINHPFPSWAKCTLRPATEPVVNRIQSKPNQA